MDSHFQELGRLRSEVGSLRREVSSLRDLLTSAARVFVGAERPSAAAAAPTRAPQTWSNEDQLWWQEVLERRDENQQRLSNEMIASLATEHFGRKITEGVVRGRKAQLFGYRASSGDNYN